MKTTQVQNGKQSCELGAFTRNNFPAIRLPQHALDIVCLHGYSLSWQHGSEHMYVCACIKRSTAPASKVAQPRFALPAQAG